MGTFFAPAIIFFAFSGALQTFGLHESRAGDTNRPFVWITKLAQLHKKQNLDTRPPNQGPPKRTEEPARLRGENRPPPRRDSTVTFVLKVFTGLMSVGLILTTTLGLFMAFQFSRNKAVPWVLLIAGTIVPLALILLM